MKNKMNRLLVVCLFATAFGASLVNAPFGCPGRCRRVTVGAARGAVNGAHTALGSEDVAIGAAVGAIVGVAIDAVSGADSIGASTGGAYGAFGGIAKGVVVGAAEGAISAWPEPLSRQQQIELAQVYLRQGMADRNAGDRKRRG